MNRRLISTILATMMLVLLSACGAEKSKDSSKDSTSPTDQTYHWKLAHEEYEGEYMDIYARKFKDEVEAKSEGRITVDIYPVGTLGEGTNLVEQLQAGIVEFACNSPSSTATLIPEANIFGIDFLLPTELEDAIMLMRDGEAAKYLNTLYEERNMHVLDWYSEGYLDWSSNRELRTPADIKGMKMRVQATPLMTICYQAYGASPVSVPYMELYSALQLNMAEGQVNGMHTINTMKFYEVQKYAIRNKFNSFLAACVANNDYWATLPDDIQQIAIDACYEANEYTLGKWYELDEAAFAAVSGAGVEVYTLTDDERAQFEPLIDSKVINAYLEIGGESGEKLYNLMIADKEKLAN